MASISMARRKALPKSDFAVPSKAPAHGSYPVDTPGRARAALSYGARFASPSELSKIRAKVHKRFPSIGQSNKTSPLSSMS